MKDSVYTLEAPLTAEGAKALLVELRKEDRGYLIEALERRRRALWYWYAEKLVNYVAWPNKNDPAGFKCPSSADSAKRVLAVLNDQIRSIELLLSILKEEP